MDSSINPDLIAFASDLALAVNVMGAVIFAVVIRHLWLATEVKPQAPRAAHASGPAGTAHPCPAL
ncbi:MAG TPA: hypothetical protein VGU20_09605 [Stellaceae bacterium]|nr:hypothetical protein [Stellaceae bacterium]